MLSVQECRKALGSSCALSDLELEQLRDQLYGIADIAISRFRLGDHIKRNGLKRALEAIPCSAHEALEERAAIMEFDGNVPVDTAERFTISEFLENNFKKEGQKP